MSESHLAQLKSELNRRRWVIIKEEEGNDYDILGTWSVSRPDGTEKRHIEFEGLSDLETLPIEQAYGCRVLEAPELSLYFARTKRSRARELGRFLDVFDNLTI